MISYLVVQKPVQIGGIAFGLFLLVPFVLVGEILSALSNAQDAWVRPDTREVLGEKEVGTQVIRDGKIT